MSLNDSVDCFLNKFNALALLIGSVVAELVTNVGNTFGFMFKLVFEIELAIKLARLLSIIGSFKELDSFLAKIIKINLN